MRIVERKRASRRRAAGFRLAAQGHLEDHRPTSNAIKGNHVPEATADRLNIHLITSDQQHWDTLGFLNPGEVRNLWDDPASQGIKQELLQKMLWAEMGKEPMWMPRIAAA